MMTPFVPRSVLFSIGLTVLAMLSFSLMNVTIRLVVEHVPAPQMVFLRNVFSLCLIIPWIISRKESFALTFTQRVPGHFWRAGIGFIAMELWFYSLSIVPVTTATALSFTTPIFATIFAVFLLKEHAGIRRVAANAVGFFGVLVILRPDAETFSIGGMVVLASSMFMALAGTLVKRLTQTEAPETIVFYMALFMAPLSLPFALVVWQPLPAAHAGALVLVALFSSASQLLMAHAFRHAHMTALLPLDFLRLVFTGLFAYMLFGETIDAHTLLGTLIILGSSVYIVHREAIRRKERIA